MIGSGSWGRRLIHALTITVAVAAGCRLPPPKPVLVYVPTSVVVDFDAPRGRDRVVSGAKTFWQAMSLLDTGFAAKHPVTPDQQAFSHALGLVMTGQQDEAELALDSIGASTDDTLIRATSRVLLTAMLQYQDKWKILAELAGGTKRDSIYIDDVNKADVESWASAFKNVKARSISFPAKPVTLPLILSASGTPMVTVSVNGKPKVMWLDTGSSMSIVSSDVATECAVAALVPDTLEVATTTGHVPARPAAIDRIEIGGIQILNSTAMIVANDLMQVRVGDTNNPVFSINIDGVIGFDIVSRMDIRIDYVNKLVTFMKPEPVRGRAAAVGRNLFWVGTPIVRLVSEKGVPLHFNLDTGAQETYSTDGLVAKTKTRTFAGERRLIGGLAGLQVVHGRFIDEVRMSMAGQRLVFRKMLVYAPAVVTFVPIDGVLGSDVGKSGIVRIDATNGLFLLESQRYDQGLKIKS
ncbi:MAG TPA: retropepsin-like aspartic protease [Gemmatimonadaceae bacterium]|nr:retropepsin-like aspartic protease [Gemmatimonadaceae bacterium]